MPSIKDISLEVIKNLPESCTMEDIMIKLNMTAEVIEGLEDKKEGRTHSTNDVLNHIKKKTGFYNELKK